MPDPIDREIPRGQARGNARDQTAFLSQTQPADDLAIEEPETSLMLDEFGDFGEVLFSPTDRPDEDESVPFTGLDQEHSAPPPDLVRLSQDPDLSSELRGILSLAVLTRIARP